MAQHNVAVDHQRGDPYEVSRRASRVIHSGLLSLAQHNVAVDHQRGDPYEVSRRVSRMIDRGLLSQEQRKCTVDHREDVHDHDGIGGLVLDNVLAHKPDEAAVLGSRIGTPTVEYTPNLD